MTSVSTPPFSLAKSAGLGVVGAFVGLVLAALTYAALLLVLAVVMFFASPFIGGTDASGNLLHGISQLISPAYYVLLPVGVVIGFVRGFSRASRAS